MEVLKKKISVIIPVYNNEKFLRECLDSVVGQTLDDIEIICVNDGSTDASLSILKEYSQKDSRIVLISQKNKGQGSARNKGMKAAQGECIFFLDSDDYLLPNTLKIIYDKYSETKSDVVSILIKPFPFGESERIIRRANFLDNKWINKTPYENYQMTLQNYTYNIESLNGLVCGRLFSRNFILKNKLKFIENHVPQEDDGFWLKVCSCFPKYTSISQSGIMYRIRENSTTTGSTKDKTRKNIEKNLKDVFSYFDKQRKKYSRELKNQIKNSKTYCHRFEVRIGFLYKYKWYKDSKAIVLLGIPLYRETIKGEYKIIRVFFIPIYRQKFVI